MKKIILISLLVAVIFLAGCTQNPTQNNQNNEDKCPFVERPADNDECSYFPVYDAGGICIRNYECQPKQNTNQDIQETMPGLKEFTIEGNDLGLYPETITVNKGDKVKIMFKVRQDKVYYGGLDFRSDAWGDTGKILPGGSEAVEFTADETFEFKSYWPSSNKLKATGTVNVV